MCTPIPLPALLVCLCIGAGAPDDMWNSLRLLRGEPDPHRSLTAREADQLVHQILVVLGRSASGERGGAAIALGERIHHRAALPAMRLVVHDEAEDAGLRLLTMREMLMIGVPEALGDAVRLLRSPDATVRLNAWEMLVAQHHAGLEFGFRPSATGEENEAATKLWEEWWQANKATFTLSMARVLKHR